MAILAAMGNNLRFQTPDLQPGINNMTMGLQTLADMAKDHRLDRERDSFLAAMGSADTSTLEGRKLADMANIQARAFGVDTGGYDNIIKREENRRNEILSNYKNYLLRANGLTASLANLVPETDIYKTVIADRDSFMKAANALREEGLRNGINPNYFVPDNNILDNAAQPNMQQAVNRSSGELSELLPKLNLKGNVSEQHVRTALGEANLPYTKDDVLELVKLQNGLTASDGVNNQTVKGDEAHKIEMTRGQQSINDNIFNNKLNDWKIANPTWDRDNAALNDGVAIMKQAQEAFNLGNYQQAANLVNTSIDDSQTKFGFSLFGVKINPGKDGVTPEQAMNGIKAYRAKLVEIENRINAMKNSMPRR